MTSQTAATAAARTTKPLASNNRRELSPPTSQVKSSHRAAFLSGVGHAIPRGHSAMASPSLFPRIGLDLDSLLDRLLLDHTGRHDESDPRLPSEDVSVCGRASSSSCEFSSSLSWWHRLGLTLTVLDPLRLSPPFQSPSDRLESLLSVCDTFGLGAEVTTAMVARWRVTSLAQAAMLDEEAIKVLQVSVMTLNLEYPLALPLFIRYLEPYARYFCITYFKSTVPIIVQSFDASSAELSGAALRSLLQMSSSLSNRRPLDPIYSIKRLVHKMGNVCRRRRRDAAATEYLDLAAFSSPNEKDNLMKVMLAEVEERNFCNPETLRSIYSEAAEVI